MKIGIISDIHDQAENLEWALNEIGKLELDQIFALGDYASPYTIKKLGMLNVPIVAVWGNNDGDKIAMMKAAQNSPGKNIYFKKGDFAEVEYDGEIYFITHYPLLAENAAKSGKYKAVFHGHTHKKRNEIINDTPIVNPGKLAVYYESPISFAVYDTVTEKTKFVEK